MSDQPPRPTLKLTPKEGEPIKPGGTPKFKVTRSPLRLRLMQTHPYLPPPRHPRLEQLPHPCPHPHLVQFPAPVPTPPPAAASLPALHLGQLLHPHPPHHLRRQVCLHPHPQCLLPHHHHYLPLLPLEHPLPLLFLQLLLPQLLVRHPLPGIVLPFPLPAPPFHHLPQAKLLNLLQQAQPVLFRKKSPNQASSSSS